MMMLNSKDMAYRKNPYPIFKRLREEGGLCRIDPFGFYGVTRHADVQLILKLPNIFSSAEIVQEPLANTAEFLLYSRGLIGTDKPDHTRLRRLLSKAFTPKTIAGFEQNIIHLAEKLIRQFPSAPFDFMQYFASPLPMTIMAELIGIDYDRIHDFKRWVEILLSWRHQVYETIIPDIEAMFQYINEVIAARKSQPRNDLISSLIAACDDEEIITDSELLAFIRLLLVAGTETTTNLFGNGMLALVSHPEQCHHLREDLSRIPAFIDEALRYDGPALSLSRRVTQDYELCGVTLKKNDIVLPLLASANHDETVFTNPEEFNITRDSKAHVAFGGGIHLCLGSMLAKLQARIGFTALLQRFEHIKFAQQNELVYLDSFFFRGLRRLDVVAK
ncbi:MAG TPA: cytochrome P450 [Gammaproteobacteria bacterium]|nr:cytochrome P450 [Gammaproteobacteria bacterium]